ncbi:MAG: HK97 gp10 family phage protein [Ruminococcus sp.]|nr:HK97 gp10 family phage protein [Ruminococcus sp.]
MTSDELTKALTKACRDFTDEVKEKVENKVNQIAGETVEEVKSLAPVYKGKNKNTPKGRYKRSWKYSIEKKNGTINAIVHSTGRQCALTYILENGTLNHDGTVRSRKFPHISVADENMRKKIEKLFEDLL